MKKIIKGKLYDTDTASRLATWDNNLTWKDFDFCEESLYRKRTGEYFLLGCGGARSKYSVSCGNNSWSGGESIIPLSFKAAIEWAQEHMPADDYMAEFGPVPESDADERVTLSISLDAATADRIRKAAHEAGTSVSALIASKF